MVTKLGFIGLGKMGAPMARNLLNAGFPVTVYDVSQAAVTELSEAGASTATSPAGVARESEITWMMVHAEQVGEVLLGDDGYLEGAASGTFVIDGGNCDPVESRRHASAAADAGISYLDAGCSGAPKGANEGSLAIMVGGDEAAYERCLPVFSVVGGRIAYLGPSGNGHLSKIVNNMITKMSDIVIAEALTLASRSGLDVATLLDVITTGTARSFVLSQARELFHDKEEDRYQPTFGEVSSAPVGGENQLIWGIRQATELGLSLPVASLIAEVRKSGPSGGRSEVLRTAAQLIHRYAGEHIDSPPQ